MHDRSRPLSFYAAVAATTAVMALPRPASAQAGRPARDTTRQDTAGVVLRTVEVRGSVTGLGKVRGGNAIGRSELQGAAEGTSALKVIERLPGVNVQSSDPFGLYEWANRITIRGFQTAQIGQTFDGITLGDMSYGNFNGLGVGRAVDAENLEEASVTQGSGALGTASSNNLGGVVQYGSADPRNATTFALKQMIGTANARKTFGRFDTGLLGDLASGLGVKGFLSVSRLDTDKWKGAGERFSPEARSLFGGSGLFGHAGQQWQDQVNAKVQALVGPHTITAYYDFADRKEADYVDLSYGRWKASGRDWDELSSWSEAKQFATSQTPDEAYYFSSQGARRDNLAYVSGNFVLADNARLIVSPYVHTDRGAGDWHAPSYGSSWSPDPIYFRQTQYDDRRLGATARATLELPSNRLEVGAWFEDNRSTIRRVGWRLQDFANGPDVDFSDVLRLFFDRTGDIKTTTLHAQNITSLLDDRLKLTYGVKYLYIGADYTNNGLTRPAATAPDVGRPNFSFPTNGGLLPQVGLVYSASSSAQLFANFASNVNAFPYSPQTGVYNTDPTAFQFFRDHTDPEKANTYELGLRTRSDRLETSIAGYYIPYHNRLIGVAVCPLTATCVSSFANVGDVQTKGIEGLLALRVTNGLTWRTSAAYNSSTIQDDYTSGTTVVHSSGKDVVDAPRLMGSSMLRLDRGPLTGSFGARYVAKRYFSILNDMSVPAYTTFDASAGYRVTRLSAARDVMVRLNAVNLFDANYISTIGTGGFTVTGDNQTLQTGTRRLVFLTVGTQF